MVRPPTEKEWERLFYYAKLIRVFQVEHGRRVQEISESVLRAMFSMANGPLFPNIRHLSWPMNGIQLDTSGYLTSFISHTLEVITIRSPYRMTKAGMDSLCLVKSLKQIDIPYPGHTEALIPLRQLLSQSLHLSKFAFALPLEPCHITTLASMDRLRTLKIQLSKTYNWKKCLPSGLVFTVLDSLSVCFENIPHAVDFFDALLFPYVTTLCISFESRALPPPDQVERLAVSIVSRFSGGSIKNTGSLFWQTQKSCRLLKNITIMSKCSRRLPWFANSAIRPHNLAPFLRLPFIQSFRMNANWCYDLDNTFLRDMARSWCRLQDLRMDVCGSWPPAQDCRIDLLGILPFVEGCPNISSLRCRIEGKAPSSYSNIGGKLEPTDSTKYRARVGCNGLKELSVGDGEINSDDVEDAAVFISKVCPNLQNLSSWEHYETGGIFGDNHHISSWAMVERWAKRLAVVRNEARKRARNEICNPKDGWMFG